MHPPQPPYGPPPPAGRYGAPGLPPGRPVPGPHGGAAPGRPRATPCPRSTAHAYPPPYHPGPHPKPDPGPSPLFRAGSILGTVAAAAATLAVGIVSSTYDNLGIGSEPAGWQVGLTLLWWLLAAGLATLVVWRDRHAVVVCAISAAAGILTPVGALAPLLALPFVIARDGRRKVVAACTAATTLAVGASFWRDAARDGEAVIFSIRSPDSLEISYLLPVGYVVLGVLCLGLSIGAGLLRLAIGRADAAQEVAAAENRRAQALSTQAAELRTELSRQDERELIAREMHDTVAHNLSMVSLHASALEVSQGDPEVVDAARSMRSNAHRALDEMRALITSLRSGAEQYTGSAPALGDLAGLLDEARAAGVDLAATVFVADADTAPPALTRAVYRVVQESLTNVMKHAPGARAEVDVRARPGDGVDVTVRNALTRDLATDTAPPSGAPAATLGLSGVPGSGAGIIGMRERCAAVGGTFDAGVDDGRFVVRAHLPWARPTA
ncbi:sensor histidine kinase [Cellulosimicrobium cellulans]|uniref:sensor histidine kinase n=1 Tax=Cellulosimicrobium cellulans TaxID=1710 RepID=UPI0012FE1761|nr:histidine kinase [Cellulosimicrobium cellulans]